ncbi:MAG: hypothetical protein AAB538_03580 [Patescibacteria group bacterium]
MERPEDACLRLRYIAEKPLEEIGEQDYVLALEFITKDARGREIFDTFRLTLKDAKDLFALLTHIPPGHLNERGQASARKLSLLNVGRERNDSYAEFVRVKFDPVSNQKARREIISVTYHHPGQGRKPEAFVRTADLVAALRRFLPDPELPERMY